MLESPSGASRRLRVEVVVDYNSTTEALSSEIILAKVLEDRIGVVAEVMAKLAEAKINVTACDAVAAGEGRYGAILWVKPGDAQKAARVLGANK